jgi:hypothetical protein
MPNPKQHQEKADHNSNFLKTILDDAFCDWKATIAFYVAVHLVEKLRAYDGKHSENHEERDRYVRANHHSIYNAYHQLFTVSLVARYKSLHAFQISPDDVQSKLIASYLAEIEKFVARVTASKLPPRPSTGT